MPGTVITAVLTGRWPRHLVGPGTPNMVSNDPEGDIALGNRYARVMRDMCARWAPGVPFICFADREVPGVETRLLPPYISGWNGRLYNFSPSQFPVGTRVLSTDLDNVIVGPLAPLLTVPLDQPVFIRGTWMHAHLLRGGLWSAAITDQTRRIWLDLEEGRAVRPRDAPPYFHPRVLPHLSPDTPRRFLWTDEQWFQHYFQEPVRFRGWQDVLPPGTVRGWKKDLKQTAQPLDKECSVVYFDALPRPHQVEAPWNPHWQPE